MPTPELPIKSVFSHAQKREKNEIQSILVTNQPKAGLTKKKTLGRPFQNWPQHF